MPFSRSTSDMSTRVSGAWLDLRSYVLTGKTFTTHEKEAAAATKLAAAWRGAVARSEATVLREKRDDNFLNFLCLCGGMRLRKTTGIRRARAFPGAQPTLTEEKPPPNWPGLTFEKAELPAVDNTASLSDFVGTWKPRAEPNYDIGDLKAHLVNFGLPGFIAAMIKNANNPGVTYRLDESESGGLERWFGDDLSKLEKFPIGVDPIAEKVGGGARHISINGGVLESTVKRGKPFPAGEATMRLWLSDGKATLTESGDWNGYFFFARVYTRVSVMK